MSHCKQLHLTGKACDSCIEQSHIYLRSTIHCHASNRETVAAQDSAVVCDYMDKHCPICHSAEVSRFEMDESFEHQCKRCGEIWLKFMDDGERLIVGEMIERDAA